ncbi:caspase family protein [Phormidium tenue FACHB-886]|nr:caspase family protein [Phormidium tenue FACHB-886]
MSRDALVVGINTYKFLPSLKAPAQDAEAIAQQLQRYGEFRVHRLPEVIQDGKPQIGQKTAIALRELETALINLFKPKGNSIPQTAVFYFSGHGIQRDAGIQEGYLALSDSNPEKGIFGLSLFWLRRLLQESPVRQRIVILDCCNSGELLNFLEADPGARPGTDRLFMAAAREYETAYESLNSPYSIFTQAILTGLDPHRNESGIVTNHSLTDWVSHNLKGEIQQPLFESSGSEIILTRCGTEQPPAPLPQPGGICPYRGMECFNEDHAEYFFGREALTGELLEKVQHDRFVAVVGASGIGKSSLVRAGLMAQLKQSSTWQIKLFTPTDRPLRSLASAFIDLNASQLDRADQLRRAESFLQDGGRGLAQLVQASLPNSPTEPHARMLLVIDQFEEVFTLSQGLSAEQERQQFFNCLLQALEIANGRLSIVIVLREDFQAKCALYEGFAQQLDRHCLLVTPLKYEQIKATILKPARKVGLVCEPSLVYNLLLDAIGAPGELALLQCTLLELWQRCSTEGKAARLTLEAYQELGGISGTLQKRATEVFEQLTEVEQSVAKRVFLALTQLGEGTEDTRRHAMKLELVSPAFPAALIEQVLEKLVSAKLVVTSQEGHHTQPQRQQPLPNSATEMIDIAHETLIRHWSLLRSWLDSDREMLRRLRRIEQAAREWNSVGQPPAEEYLLHGLRLRDAEDFQRTYPGQLSAVAHQYVTLSHEEIRRARRESRQLQIAVPAVLLVTLMAIFTQYRGAVHSQAEKDRQLQIVTARERAAIAQNILQEKSHDPMAALLVSRVAAESSKATSETQTSLRAVLQALRLQLELPGHTGAVRQLAFSPDRHRLATAGADGTIRLWAVSAQTIYSAPPQPPQILAWSNSSSEKADVLALAFSPDGQQLAAVAKDSPIVKIWSVATGTLRLQLISPTAVTQAMFSPDGNWIATVQDDRTLSIWKSDTGQLQVRLPLVDKLTSLQFSPNGQMLLATSAKTTQLWRLEVNTSQRLALQPLASLKHTQPVIDARFSPNGHWIATACQDGKIRLWLPSGQLRQTIAPVSQIAQAFASVQFSPDSRLIAAINRSHHVWLWDTQSGKLQAELGHSSEHAPGITAWLQFSPDGRFVLTSTDNRHNAVRLWNSHTGREINVLGEPGGVITAAQFSSDSTYVATASLSGLVQLWATESNSELPTIHTAGAIDWMAFLPAVPSANPDATSTSVNQLKTLTADGRVQNWRIVSDAVPSVPARANGTSQPASPLQTAAIKPLNFWQRLLGFSEHPSAVTSSEASGLQPAPKPIPVSAELGQSTLSETLISADLDAAPTSTQWAAAAISPDSSWIATATSNGVLELRQIQADRSVTVVHRIQNWRSIMGKETPLSEILPVTATSLQFRGEHVSLSRLSFSPDSSKVMGIGDDLIVRLWDVRSGQLLQTLRGHEAMVQQARFSPDGQFVITASRDKIARIWQVSSGQTVRILPHSHTLASASFSPDGQQVVTTSWNGKAYIWDVASGKQEQQLEQQAAVLDAQFSPDGQLLVTASADGTAMVWDASTGAQQAHLSPLSAQKDTPEPIVQVSFSPDGQFIATRTQTSKVYLWAATPEMLLELARQRSLRQLTTVECSKYLSVASDACPNLVLGDEMQPSPGSLSLN